MSKRAKPLLLLAVVIILGILAIYLGQLARRSNSQELVEAKLQFARPDWLAEESFTDQTDLRDLATSLQAAEHSASPPPNHEQPVYRLLLETREQPQELWLTHDLQVYNLSLGQRLIIGPPGQRVLEKYAKSLRSKQFGGLLPWSEAKQLIPLYSIFSVVDLETGLTFKTQRRAGSLHGDIQPLTKQDTEILKTIYNGEWSWDRRAVIVEIGGRRIAASMHGMPHGAGALVNGFPGHHCLHFLGSLTHGGSRIDPMHQVMVQKAAGRLYEYLDQLPPDELRNLAMELAGQGDTATIGLIIINSGNGIEALANQIRDIRVWTAQVESASDGKQIGKYSVSVFFRGDQREYRTNVTVTCRYGGNLGKWLVEPDYLQQLVNARR